MTAPEVSPALTDATVTQESLAERAVTIFVFDTRFSLQNPAHRFQQLRFS